MSRTLYVLKNQDGLKFLKPAERAELDAATQAWRDSEGGHACRTLIFCEAPEQCTCVCHKLGYVSHGDCCGAES